MPYSNIASYLGAKGSVGTLGIGCTTTGTAAGVIGAAIGATAFVGEGACGFRHDFHLGFRGCVGRLIATRKGKTYCSQCCQVSAFYFNLHNFSFSIHWVK
jgi:hypothetical protein